MRIAIIGGGITGLSAADELAIAGHEVTIYEKDKDLGGLAGYFWLDGVRLEKFYHHIFTNDTAIADKIHELGLGDQLDWQPTTTSYFVNKIYRLSKPTDLLKFDALNLFDRFRLGVLYLQSRFIGDWYELEKISSKDWLIKIAGKNVYQKIWAPLLKGKFGQYADEIAAVWIWNKLKLRGSSRGKGQEERLGYLKGGFGQVIEAWESKLKTQNVTANAGSRCGGTKIKTGMEVRSLKCEAGRVIGVEVTVNSVNGIDGVKGSETETFDQVLVTVAPEVFTKLTPDLPKDYADRLNSIKYLANVCLLMNLDRSLSNTYWLNVGDPTIPFTGVIEHTNMQNSKDYGGKVLAYLTKYLDPADLLYQKDAEGLLDYYLPHLQKMFKGFSRDWVKNVWLWKERYTQPVIGLNYSKIKPEFQTPIQGLWYCSMASIYPEDRGMNYAVIYGQKVAKEIIRATQ